MHDRFGCMCVNLCVRVCGCIRCVNVVWMENKVKSLRQKFSFYCRMAIPIAFTVLNMGHISMLNFKQHLQPIDCPSHANVFTSIR